MMLGNFLSQLIGKTVDKIYLVDYNYHDRREDIYSPRLFFFTFFDFQEFLEIEGDIDSEHISIGLNSLYLLPGRLKENDLSRHPHLWQPYGVTENEPPGQLINKRIIKVEYAVDKPTFVINGTQIEGRQDIFTAVKFYFDCSFMTIFDGGLGLLVTVDTEVVPEFTETYDWYVIE